MKIWTSTEIFTEDQAIRVQPTEVFEGITLEFKESNDKVYGHCLYLGKHEMHHLINVMRQMMEHVENSK
jgi:hypothetical protein